MFTAGLNTFVRRKDGRGEVQVNGEKDTGSVSGRKIPDWRGGKGVRGGWDCVGNGECGFLSGGAERGWYVSWDLPRLCVRANGLCVAGISLGRRISIPCLLLRLLSPPAASILSQTLLQSYRKV